MELDRYTEGLLDFLRRSPTPYHAVRNGRDLLEDAGFCRLQETDDWQLAEKGAYYILRADSSLIAFTRTGANNPLHMAGAHTDSPGLKIKPRPDIAAQGCGQLGVEVYGGALLNPWFDRDLSIAGRACWLDAENLLHCSLVDFGRPVAVIPSLAIHLDREANQSRSINKQTDLLPILFHGEAKSVDFSQTLLEEIRRTHARAVHLLDFDLFLYDMQPPARIGLKSDMITGARLDNLVSCYCLLRALMTKPSPDTLIVLNDHEEVGSASDVGAQGPFLHSVLERLLPEPGGRQSVLRRSFFISADNAHGAHPNFAAKHDPQHLPKLNRGPVIKVNANQRYATSAVTASRFRQICRQAEVPVQEFVMRNDLACGSTIGPLTATGIGVPTVDVGVASFAMHSIRETIGVEDSWHLYRLLATYFSLMPGSLAYPGVEA